MRKRTQSEQAAGSNAVLDFISVVEYNGSEFKLVFRKADACEKFKVFVVEKGKILDSLELEKKEEGVWRAMQPVPEWVIRSEEKISMLINRYNHLQAS